MNYQNIDLVVVGGGSSGCAAATVVSRNRWKTLVVDASVEEGFLGALGNVSYFPGLTDVSSGADLIRRFRKQAELVGVTFKQGRVDKILVEGGSLAVSAAGSETIEAKAVLLASGAASRSSYLHGEREFMGRGVSHDAKIDGPVYTHRRVAVIGKNNTSAQEALRLTRFASQVIFIIPSSKLDASESIQREVREAKKIEPYFSTSLKKINGTDHVNSITVFTGGQEKDIEVNGVFPYIHDYRPANDYLKGTVEMADDGAVKIDNEFRTSAKGVFACGDILCGRPQIPAIACAQGTLAGLKINEYLGGKS